MKDKGIFYFIKQHKHERLRFWKVLFRLLKLQNMVKLEVVPQAIFNNFYLNTIS